MLHTAQAGERRVDREARDYWRQQRRANARRRGPGLPGPIAAHQTAVLLIALTLLGFIILNIGAVQGLLFTLPGWGVLFRDLLSSVFPGTFPSGILSLLLDGLFIWLIAAPVDALDAPWKLIVAFFIGGGLGAFAFTLFIPVLIAPSYAPFALAGVFAYVMATHRAGPGRTQAFSWAIGLLVLNVLLSGFNLAPIAAMVGAFVGGMAVSAATEYGH